MTWSRCAASRRRQWARCCIWKAACSISTASPSTALWSRSGNVMRKASTTIRVSRARSEEHTSELQSLRHLVCRLLLEKKKNQENTRANGVERRHRHTEKELEQQGDKYIDQLMSVDYTR